MASKGQSKDRHNEHCNSLVMLPTQNNNNTNNTTNNNNNNSRTTDEEHFPMKLHRMLKEADTLGFSDCITWMPDGTSFKIVDKAKFEAEVMPRYFASSKFKSLQRSLNMWGFTASNKHSDSATGGGRRNHALFVKDKPELCYSMRRVRVKQPGTRVSNKEEKKSKNTGGYTTSNPSVSDHKQDATKQPALPPLSRIASGATSSTDAMHRVFQSHPLQGGQQDPAAGQALGNLSSLIQLAHSQPNNVLLNSLLTQTLVGLQHQHQQVRDNITRHHQRVASSPPAALPHIHIQPVPPPTIPMPTASTARAGDEQVLAMALLQVLGSNTTAAATGGAIPPLSSSSSGGASTSTSGTPRSLDPTALISRLLNRQKTSSATVEAASSSTSSPPSPPLGSFGASSTITTPPAALLPTLASLQEHQFQELLHQHQQRQQEEQRTQSMLLNLLRESRQRSDDTMANGLLKNLLVAPGGATNSSTARSIPQGSKSPLPAPVPLDLAATMLLLQNLQRPESHSV